MTLIFERIDTTADTAQNGPSWDRACAACGFRKHSHGEFSNICPVLVRGMLSMFRKEVQ